MIRRFFLITLIYSCFFVYTYSASDNTIEDIQTHNLTRSSLNNVFYNLGLRPGDEFDIDKLNKGIKKLYKLGIFKQIKVSKEDSSNGIVLHLYFQEYPSANILTIDGNDEISTTDLEKEISDIFIEGDIFSPALVNDIKNAFRIKYEDESFWSAEFSDTLLYLNDEETSAELVIIIDEGKKNIVQEIEFTGNNSFPDDDLKDEMETTEDRWYWWDDFSREEFDEDLKKIETFYRNNGFAFATVDSFDLEIVNREDIFIKIYLTERDVYSIGDISIQGNEKYPTELIETLITISTGNKYNEADVQKSLSNISTHYYENGYLFSQINITKSVNEDEKSIDILFNIYEDEIAHIGLIDISGNTKTDDKVIRRELSVFPNDIFKQSLLIRSQRNLFYLDYFENIELEHAITDSGNIDLNFKVIEKETGKFQFGVTYGADNLAGFIGFEIPNFFGHGQTVKFNWEFGGSKKNFELAYHEPWFLDTPTSVGAELHYKSTKYSQYRENRKGFSVSFSRPLPKLDYSRYYLSYSLEDIEIDIDDEDLESASQGLLDAGGHNYTSSFTISLSRDSRNSVIFADQGSLNSFTMTFAGGLFGGDVEYQKYVYKSTWNYQLVKDLLSFGVMMKLGYVSGYGDNDAPVYEKFRLGGVDPYGLRGYPDRSIGVPDEYGDVEGGNFMMLNVYQFNIPIQEQQLYALAFFDAGNAWASVIDTDISEVKKSYGIGVRIRTPMGILGLDLGKGMDDYYDDGRLKEPEWELHFQLGNAF